MKNAKINPNFIKLFSLLIILLVKNTQSKTHKNKFRCNLCSFQPIQQQIHFPFPPMSIASSSYKPKSFQQSSDLQDLRQQIKILIQQNKILTSQLQQLIDVNNQLTSSIQQYSKLHEQKFGPIDQSQLQQLANQVNQLQRQLDDQREKTYHMVMRNSQEQKGCNKNPKGHLRNSSNQGPQEAADFDIDQIYEVIKQLTNNIHYLQQDFYQQIQHLQEVLHQQQKQSQQIITQMQQKFTNIQQLTKQLIEQMHSRDQIIHNLNRQLDMHRNKKSQIVKQMKISHTIEDLRVTLEKKIEEKEQVIKYYEALLTQIKNKFSDYPV